MATTETEGGQEKHSAQLGEMVRRIQGLEKERDDLRARLDSIMRQISDAHSKAFPDIKAPSSY